MRSPHRLFGPVLCSLVLLGFVVAGIAFASPAQAAEGGSRVLVAPAQETPMPADHAAHHPGASHALTGTRVSTATVGMGGMMEQMGSMHGEAAVVLEAVLAEHGDMMTPEMAADVGHVLGMMESMHAMMQDMSGMMGGGMMGGGMMDDMPMEGMPMTGTMSMTGTMEGMDHSGMEDMDGMDGMGGMEDMSGMGGMMEMMHGDMAAMIEQMGADMPEEMAARMEAMQSQMDAMMAMMGSMAGKAMEDAMPGMEGMDHGAMADTEAPFDLLFIDSMIEHHTGAIAMAEQALDEAEREEILDLAEEIIAAQEAEIAQMEAWRAEWYPDAEPTAGMGMDMGQMELAGDDSLPFERRFMEAMISHHQGAIEMAEMALEMAERDEILELAAAIIEAQEGEIAQMVAWNDEWYPDLPPLAATSSMDMGQMGDMHTQMESMMGDMQSMMDEMMAGEDGMMTPEMAAEMGRMMGRMEGMAGMMHGMEGMMQGDMMDGMMEMPAEGEENSGN